LLKPYGYNYTMPTVDGADSLSLAHSHMHTHMHTHALLIKQFLLDPLCVADKWEKLKETESVPCKMMQSCLWNSMSMNSLWAAHWDVQDVQHLLACLLHSIAWGNFTSHLLIHPQSHFRVCHNSRCFLE
jgi:hypothetical protein